MKRFILPLLCIPILLLSSCGEPPTVQSDFAASFTARYKDTDYAGAVTKEGDRLAVILYEPYAAEGMSFCWEDSTLSVRYMSHSTDANADYLPADSVPAALHNALAYLSQAAYTGSENKEDRFTLPTPYGDAELIAQDGIPKTLTVPNTGTVFVFE